MAKTAQGTTAKPEDLTKGNYLPGSATSRYATRKAAEGSRATDIPDGAMSILKRFIFFSFQNS